MLYCNYGLLPIAYFMLPTGYGISHIAYYIVPISYWIVAYCLFHNVINRFHVMRPGDESLKSDSARLNRLTTAMDLKAGAGDVETLQLELRAANEAIR